jgi:toxin ParE1/3/4
MKGYILASAAQRDIAAIRDYYLKKAGYRVAKYILNELLSGFRTISKNPGIGHVREDLTEEPVKFWPVFSYLIVYDPEKRPVEIVRVLHGALDIPSLL